MGSVPVILQGADGDHVLSNEPTHAIFESESSNRSVENLTKLNLLPRPPKTIVHNVSEVQVSEEEDDSITHMSTNILEIIFDYALNKFDDCRDRLEAGRPKFISVLNKFVRARVRVDMCLPAFPFKSANKVYKALGILPDKAEEIALTRLDTMCQRIQEIYSAGAKVVIISDGLVYNGLFHNTHARPNLFLTQTARLIEHIRQRHLVLWAGSARNGR